MNLFVSLLLLIKIITISLPDSQNKTTEIPSAAPALFEKSGAISPALLELLQVCGIEHEGTFASVASKAQEFWYQGPKERWEFDDRFHELKEKIWPLLNDLGVLSEVKAPVQEYDYALVHGGLLKRVNSRLAFLIKEWNRGVRFHEIVILTGDRDLQPSEIADLGRKQLTNEAEMMEFVFKQTDMPEEMRLLPIKLVSAPKYDRDGKWVRPGTAETIQEWLKTSPEKGSCLAVSNQPYVGYQNAVALTYLPEGFSLITVGHAADEHTSLAIHLDNLARWINISNAQ